MVSFQTSICFISPKSYPLFDKDIVSTHGGAEVQLSLLSKALATNPKFNINLMVADYGQEDRLLIDQVRLWKSIDLKASKINQALSFLNVFNKINADIYFQRGVSLESTLIALYCRLRNKKFIYMVAHDGETDGTYYLFTNWIKQKFMELVSRFASVVIVQNKYQFNNLNFKYSRKAIHVLKKGIDISNINHSEQNKEYDGIWVGRGVDWKRPEIFIDLVKHFPENKFLMICPQAHRQNDYLKPFRSIIKKLGNLKLLEQVPHHLINRYMQQSKIYCFTSLKEGDWPMTVLEAAANKLPILSYSLNYNLLIDQYGGGILGNGTLEDFYNGFDQLVNNASLRSKKGEQAFNYISDHHDLNKNVDKLTVILNSMNAN